MTHTTRTVLLSAAMLALTSSAMSSVSSAESPPPRFGWFSDMVGACWTGRYPDGKTSDTQCYTTQYGLFLRGTIKLQGVHGNKPVQDLEGDSVYAWDEKDKKIRYSFWANDGTYGTAEAYLDGELIVFPVSDPSDSTKLIGRSVWRRIDGDTFTVTRERSKEGAWTEQFKVTYSRAAK